MRYPWTPSEVPWPRNFVYGLIDPQTLMIRYIGLSSTGVRRPRSHTRSARPGTKSHCANWVQSLLAKGLLYSIVVLEETPQDNLSNAERWWIAYGLASDWPLTNKTDGGQSASHAARAKISEALVNRKKSLEARAKMSEAAKIRMNLPEYKEAARTRALLQFSRQSGYFRTYAVSAARETRGTPSEDATMTPDARARSKENSRAVCNTPEFKAKLSERMRERMADPAERAKISAATKAAMASPEIRAKMRAKKIGSKRSPTTQAKINATRAPRRCAASENK